MGWYKEIRTRDQKICSYVKCNSLCNNKNYLLYLGKLSDRRWSKRTGGISTFMGGLTFLPYVRESKFDVKADLPGVKNKENAKKSAPKKEKVIESKSAISQSSSTTSTSTETGDKVADEI